jgi:hypothetical protein
LQGRQNKEAEAEAEEGEVMVSSLGEKATVAF